MAAFGDAGENVKLRGLAQPLGMRRFIDSPTTWAKKNPGFAVKES